MLPGFLGGFDVVNAYGTDDQGMVWGGVEALDIGLADEIMTTHEIEVLLKQETGAEHLFRVNREPFSLTSLLASAIEIGVKQAFLSAANKSTTGANLPMSN